MIKCNSGSSKLGATYKYNADNKLASCDLPKKCEDIIVAKSDTKLEGGKYYFHPDEFKNYIFSEKKIFAKY